MSMKMLNKRCSYVKNVILIFKNQAMERYYSGDGTCLTCELPKFPLLDLIWCPEPHHESFLSTETRVSPD